MCPAPGRRPTLVGVLLACALLVATACGAPPDQGAGGGAGAPAAGFPVTIDHSGGRTTVPAKPQRVVALSYGDIALAQALGASVVGAVAFPSGADGRNFPGVPPLPPETTTLDLVTPDPEKVLALQPDLILATGAQPTWAGAYDQLSRIAPTVLSRTRLLGDDPNELAIMIGRALGEEQRARDLVAGSQRRIADFAAARPGIAGKTFASGQTLPTGLQLVVGPDAASTRFFTALGLRVPDGFAGRGDPADPLRTLTLARENVAELGSADVAFVYFYEPGLREDPVLTGLDLVRSGRLQSIDQAQAYALLQVNPATTEYALGLVAPALDRVQG